MHYSGTGEEQHNTGRTHKQDFINISRELAQRKVNLMTSAANFSYIDFSTTVNPTRIFQLYFPLTLVTSRRIQDQIWIPRVSQNIPSSQRLSVASLFSKALPRLAARNSPHNHPIAYPQQDVCLLTPRMLCSAIIKVCLCLAPSCVPVKQWFVVRKCSVLPIHGNSLRSPAPWGSYREDRDFELHVSSGHSQWRKLEPNHVDGNFLMGTQVVGFFIDC